MARRPIWSGSISFALINVPVKLLPAVSPREVHFHLLHDADGGRIRERRVCEKDGREVPYAHVVKGFDLGNGKSVVLHKEELTALDPEADKTIGVEEFVHLAEIDPVYFQSTYHLVPDKGAGKAFRLFVSALERTGRAAIGRIVLRTRGYLCVLRPVKGGLALSTLWSADEVNAVPALEDVAKGQPNERELRLAETLVESLANPFKPAKYHDEHRERVLEVIEKKAKGEEVVAPEPPKPGRTLNLMAALEESLKAHGARGHAGEPARAKVQAARHRTSGRPHAKRGGHPRSA